MRPNLQAYHYSEALLGQARSDQTLKEAAPEPVKPPVRGQGFRRAIAKTDNHRSHRDTFLCVLGGLRILTVEGHTAIEAAHITP